MKRFFIFVSMLIPCLFVFSCGKDGGEQGGDTSSKAQLGVEVKDAQALYQVKQNESINLELAVVANPTSAEAYTISLAVKPSLVDSYNARKGTHYPMLPSDAFSISGNSVVLPRYSAKSSSCQIRLTARGSCAPEEQYVLPVAIESVQGGTNFEAPEDKAAFIIFQLIPTQEQGDGSKDNPFIIKDVETFLSMDAKLQDDATTCFKLGADLDLKDLVFTSDKPWVPINYAPDSDGQSAARKRVISFDGDNHTISNFKADGPLFGVLCGSVQNLTLSGFQIVRDGDDAAALIGIAGASDNAESFVMKNVKITASSVKVEPELTAEPKRAGALVAYMRGGTVESCEAACDVTGLQQVGGMIGRLESGLIKDCKASGTILVTQFSGKGGYYGGGLIGYMKHASVISCSASGNVSTEFYNYARAGGLIGEMHGGSVEKCFATGEVSSTSGHFAGGLIGVADAEEDITIIKSYATGRVYLNGTGNKAGYGGLLGRMDKGKVTITDCYSTGSIKAYRWSAGFVGDVSGENGSAILNIVGGYTSSNISEIGPDTNQEYQCGLVVGKVRKEDAVQITCSKFIAWKGQDRDLFCYPTTAVSADGNYYGNEGTISQHATALGWNTGVWDLGGSEPKLR